MLTRNDLAAAKAIMKRTFAQDSKGAVAKVTALLQQGNILIHGRYDPHKHPALQGILFGATGALFLAETKDKGAILKAIREKTKEQSDVYAYQYAVGAKVTADDLDFVQGLAYLQDSGMHMGVANRKLIAEIKRRSRGLHLQGECNEATGEVTEDYNFLAVAIIEEQFADKAVDAVEAYLEREIRGGTTKLDDKIIFTTTEADVLLAAHERIYNKYGIYPVHKVFVIYGLYKSDPGILRKLRQITPLVGIKWVNDGGTRNSHLHDLSYTNCPDGPKGPEPNIALSDLQLKTRIEFLESLKRQGITEVAWHVLAEGTWKHLYDSAIARQFKIKGIKVSLEHFTLVTKQDIRQAAELGFSINPNPPYTTEVFRPDYADVIGSELAQIINPLRIIVDVYKEAGMIDQVGLGSDGMPTPMLFTLLSAVNGVYPIQRLTLEETLALTEDRSSIMIVTPETMAAIKSTDLRTICGAQDGQTFDRREEVASKLDEGVLLVADHYNVLYEKPME